MTRKVVYVAIAQAIVLTWLANLLPTWQDEEFTLATTAHGVAYAIHRALTYEDQAPLYFALLAALRTLDLSVLLAREFSVAMQIATTLACAALARRLWPGRDPWIFCALVASNPFTVYAALEIRTYSLSLFESAVLFVAFLDGFFMGDDRRARIALVVCAIAGLYTQYFIAFEMIGLFCALGVSGRLTALRDYAACCTIVAIAFAPLALYVRGQASDTLSVEPSAPALFGGMLLHPVNLVLARDYSNSNTRWERALWIVLRLGFLGIVIAGRPRFDLKMAAMAAVFLVVDAIYVVLEDVLKINLVIPRHFVALFLPEAVLAYLIVAAFTSRHARRLAIATVAIFAVSNAVTLGRTYAAGSKIGDSRRVGAFLERNARSGDQIAVYPGDDVAPLMRYYAGALPVAGFPIAQSSVKYEVDAALVRSETEAEVAFDRLPKSKHLWFVVALICNGANIHGCETTQIVMKRKYRIVRRTPFYQAVVFELEAKHT